MPIATQRKVGRYRLDTLVGTGGMAEVYRAYDTRLDRTVAVKMVLPNLVSQRAFVERFLREARLVAALEHPNILPIYDFGEQDGVPYLVMPHMTGGTLAERVGLSGLPPECVADYVGQLADALDTAHRSDILHRDLKPSNVLMDRSERPVLADFGLARVAGAASDLTASGIMVGTPLYMAPELAEGAAASRATDLYALAVLAYQMLSGSTPFTGETPVAVLHQHVSSEIPAVSERLAGLQPEVDEFFRRALAKRPDRRFASGAELAQGLAESLGQSARIGAPAAAPAARVEPPASRHPTDVVMSGSVSVPALPERPAPVHAEPRRMGLGSYWAVVLVLLFAALGVLLGSRSLIGRNRAVATPVERPAPVGTANPDGSAEVPSLGGAPSAQPERTPFEASRRRGSQQLRRPRRLSASDFELLSERAAAGEGPTAQALSAFAAGGLAYSRGDDATAREAIDDAKFALGDAAPPKWLPAWVTDGRSAAELAEWELAAVYGDARGTGLALVDTHLGENPDDPRARLGRAMLLHLDERHQDAIDEARRLHSRVSSSDPELAGQILRFVGDEYVELEHWRDAVETYREVVRLGGPAAGPAAMEGGRIALEQLRDREDAAELFRAGCAAGHAMACRRAASLRTARPRRSR